MGIRAGSDFSQDTNASRSSGFATRNSMSVPLTRLCGFSSHFCSDVAFQTIPDSRNGWEYGKPGLAPAFLPKTPRRGGPSFAESRAWQPEQRFANSSCPALESGAPCRDTAPMASVPIKKTVRFTPGDPFPTQNRRWQANGFRVESARPRRPALCAVGQRALSGVPVRARRPGRAAERPWTWRCGR